MASSSQEAIPVKLPVPPSTPSPPPSPQKKRNHKSGNAKQADSIAARGFSAFEGEDDNVEAATTSLDVHIRWSVESGSIVRKGEKIAQLFYAFHGSPPPATSSFVSSPTNNGNATIRARAKKRWGTTASTPGDTSAKAHMNNSASFSKDKNKFVALKIRSPSHGFLRILYKNSFVVNAVQINNLARASSGRYSVINLILAAIQPCEHPAVVGGLCVVCGADTRAPEVGDVHLGEFVPRRHQEYSTKVDLQNRTGPKSYLRRGSAYDLKQQQIIEKQKKLAASMASAKEYDHANDEKLASFDMDATTGSHIQGTKLLSSNNYATAKLTPAAPKITKATGPPTAMRSLSSLLSGAKATQKMQQFHSEIPHPPQQKYATTLRPHQAASFPSSTPANLSTNATVDTKMSKMTVSGGVTITISESEAKNISEASSKKLREEKKLCLVLDLDHTLLHATDDYRAGKYVAGEVWVGDNKEKITVQKGGENKSEPKKKTPTKPNPDIRPDVRAILLPVELPPLQQKQYVQQKLEQQRQEDTNFCLSPLPQQKQSADSSIIMRHFVKLRPHLKDFFSQIQSSYQLSVYTAGTRSYAEQVALMICRHLVGATLDEEFLNALRFKVREKDQECRNYREHKARIGRKRQFESTKNREDTCAHAAHGMVKVDTTKTRSKKSTSPPGSANGKTTNGNMSSTLKRKANDAISTNIQPCVSDCDGDCTSPSQSLSLKRGHPSGEGKRNIARKKKCANSGSSLSLILTDTEPVEKKQGLSESYLSEEEEALVDPSEERDRLRTKLDEAERLEIAAVELRRKMFGSRIVSRTDVGDLGKDVKSLKRVFPCGGVMAAILDDREDVWANAKNNVTGRPGEPPENLLLVKPYHWKPFIGFADVNNASGQDLSKTDDIQRLTNNRLDDKDDDVQLIWTADILRRLHERYYSPALSQDEREGLTVPNLLKSMRKETLFRFPQVKIVFSGLIPINRQNRQTQIRPHVVRYAEELGAEVLTGISQDVTHVVAARDGSEKIKQARQEVPGCYVIHTSWLMECYWSISRRDIRLHHMGPMPTRQHARQHLSLMVNEECAHTSRGRLKDEIVPLSSHGEESDAVDDDSEDDFAADLEKEIITKGN